MKKIVEVPNDASAVWVDYQAEANDVVFFVKSFYVSKIPEEAITYISVETKYYLKINEKLVIWEGGLFRESLPGSSYIDAFDIKNYLVIGINKIEILVHYFGNEGRNNVSSGQAGLLLFCEELKLYSDRSFYCTKHPSYYTPATNKPSYLFGGDNMGFNANYSIDYKKLNNAVAVNNDRWGNLYLRPIPFIEIKEPQKVNTIYLSEGKWHAKLPTAMCFVPKLYMIASGGETVRVYSDRYRVNGGPGDEKNIYNGHYLEFVCKPGKNELESFLYLYGEEIIIELPNGITLTDIEFCETGYATDIIGEFVCDDPNLNKLVEKCSRTLYVCMRDNFMDCPDRERGQWIGDVSVQAPQVAFLLSESAILLLKKAIDDFIYLRKGDVLSGNVPGVNSSELPCQSLTAISQWGMIAQYEKYSGDTEGLRFVVDPIVTYMKLWKIDDIGLIISRKGDWQWYDHLFNADGIVIENAIYYSALCYIEGLANRLEIKENMTFIHERKKQIRNAFHKTFWRGKAYGSTASLVDDRSNAWAVLSGLCPEELYPEVRYVLLSVFNSSIYMESFVLTALCEMGYVEEAYKRMMSRYYPLINNSNSTIWEDFYHLGTKNHGWSGFPATMAYKYLMGIDTNDGFKTMTVDPKFKMFSNMKCKFDTPNGKCRINVNGNETKDNKIRIEYGK